ncbi:phage holin family protein [Paenibacillus sp. RRE4]|uniref:phage holin family protein n=1 Tax=Paenibacillus sp. RRE4 TaxID=2962587 RepID=UPI002881106F|nr:phage holin family protein [Paenibacillus sp. RRE4]MDT0123859.1 phage holin family protein [Paenibacillus sp. RRE4]
MDWSTVFSLIDPKLFIVLAACWVLGIAIKRIPRIPDWTIIFIITVFAILMTCWLLGWSPESLIQGILVGAFSVYGNEALKQAKKGTIQS